ncbi:MAG: DUF423 domain-containing protein [Saprospiraceae bacterium]|uniref:DUF423 domain-containing protein n=1 Tax=Candidatus Opimibacter skivensis TaxID=2982028 RepID=A0A9D7SQT9_9BACT|nr:DUF423 domain-containing protein [Candidatus Opimibacter skivensis]
MNSFYRRLLAIGSLLGAFGVIFGAFGAHFLKNRLETPSLDIIRTGVLYLFIHVLVLLFVVILGIKDENSRLLRSAGIFFISGVILFSGSLFYIATESLTGLNIPFIGVLTPIGGLCFIIGWGMLSLYPFSNK